MDPNMPSPIRITFSSRLKLWKLMKDSGWFPGCIFRRGVCPLDEDFLDRVTTQVPFLCVKNLFKLEPNRPFFVHFR